MTTIPTDYPARREWQNAHAAAGQPVPCGREACARAGGTVGAVPWTNAHTPLLYCQRCAHQINRYTPGMCSPSELDVCMAPLVHSPIPEPPMNPTPAFLLMAGAMGADLPPMPLDRPEPTPRPETPADRARLAKAEARRERIRARNLANLEPSDV
jgi:hypothetical protein